MNAFPSRLVAVWAIFLACSGAVAGPMSWTLENVPLNNFGWSQTNVEGSFEFDGGAFGNVNVISPAGSATTCVDADANNFCDSPLSATGHPAVAFSFGDDHVLSDVSLSSCLVLAAPAAPGLARVLILNFEDLLLATSTAAVLGGVEYFCVPGSGFLGSCADLVDVDVTPFRAVIGLSSNNPDARLVASVPAPMPLALLTLGLAGLALGRRGALRSRSPR